MSSWRPAPQPKCEPGCTCDLDTATVGERPTVAESPEPRTCTEQDPCSFCGPVERFWDSDPAPAEAPAEPGQQKTRPLKREPGGVWEGSGSSPAPFPPMSTSSGAGTSDSPPVLAHPSEGFLSDRVSAQSYNHRTRSDGASQAGIIRRIFNATRRNT